MTYRQAAVELKREGAVRFQGFDFWDAGPWLKGSYRISPQSQSWNFRVLFSFDEVKAELRRIAGTNRGKKNGRAI